MSFFKKMLNKGKNIDPMDDKLKEKIERLVVSMLDDYGNNYNVEYKSVREEWTESGKEFTESQLDEEAHNRAGIESFKDTVANKVNDEVEDDVEANIKKQTDNSLVVTASKKAAEKSIDILVSKLIDEGIKKLKHSNN